MFASPVTVGRPIACKNGPATKRESWYCTAVRTALSENR
jgi:hypothetical protein